MRGFGGKGGFGGLGDIAGMMKKVQKAQDDMAAMQEELEAARVEATSGGGMVKAVVSGKGRVVNLEIRPEAVDPDDVEMLQDLVVAAVNEAGRKVDAAVQEKIGGMTAGMRIPGLT